MWTEDLTLPITKGAAHCPPPPTPVPSPGTRRVERALG